MHSCLWIYEQTTVDFALIPYNRRMKNDHDSEGTGEDQASTEPERLPTRAERIEQLLLIGGLDAPIIRAKLIEEGIATRVSLATVEREIGTIRARWQATAKAGMADAGTRLSARLSDLYARTIALADRTADSAPKVALAALVQAVRVTEAEARLLGISGRNLPQDWLAGASKQEEERQAAEARKQERLAHSERLRLWKEQVDEELRDRIEEALAGEAEAELEQLIEVIQLVRSSKYEEEIGVPEDDLWEPELRGELVSPEDIEDPRTHWNALAREELANHPQALELVLETIASYEPPEGYPGPFQLPYEEEMIELLGGPSALNA